MKKKNTKDILATKTLICSKGQITIFFSTTILILITFLAFIINIGIFVKAKINLQNATDAAAFAGASVQARQLTDIAYLNWEMRNIYKEWMFKYYILGGLNLEVIDKGPGAMVGTNSKFTMASFRTGSRPAVDNYNFPSVCIDFADTGSVGLCTKYLIPGLPRFSSSNVLGMDETTNAFIDSIVSEKAKDCSRRSQINFFTANAWAYHVNVEDPSLKNISAQAPQIALESGGAFPNAFELALRMRNMEARVNTKPFQATCANTGRGVDCANSINDLISNNPSPGIERVVKAYQSGARNLGSDGDPELRASFTLTELSPNPYRDPSANSLSNLLIPNNHEALNKYYVDLKIMPINYSTFYTAFTTNQGDYTNIAGSGLNASSEAQCTATKIGLPVPGYIMGFVKNPDVLTYYAVKGEVNFVGLFNPFAGESIKLTAYAAAKPFGGRIGPHLFKASDSTKIFPRENLKSSSYISTIDTSNLKDQYGTPAGNKYIPGAPLPINFGSGDKKFWLDRSDTDGAIGGWVSGKNIYFGIPNIPYDYPSPEDLKNKTGYTAGQSIEVIDPNTGTPQAGLYNKDILEKLRSRLPRVGSGAIDSQTIQDALIVSRAPTLYDIANYLVPTHENHNLSVQTDSYGTITQPQRSNSITAGDETYTVYDASIYAPILSETSIYGSSSATVQDVLKAYIANLEPAIKKYVGAMNLAAANIYQNNSSTATGQNLGLDAANAISDIPEGSLDSSNDDEVSDAVPTCKSISGKFSRFLLGEVSDVPDGPDCVTSLQELMIRKWTSSDLGQARSHNFTYALPQSFLSETRIFSAYRPGPTQGADEEGNHAHPFKGENTKMVRNFYSTKFVPLSSISSSGSYFYRQPITSEGSFSTNTTGSTTFKNSLRTEEIDVDLSTIKH